MIRSAIKSRVLIMDGAMGTMIQSRNVNEVDFKGERFANWHKNIDRCYSLLSITMPELIKDIHRSYLDAGADIITTNSFNSNALSLSKHGLDSYEYEINYSSAIIARQAIIESRYKGRFVAGTVAPIVCSDDTLLTEELYTTQIRGLVEGGVDIILLETILNSAHAQIAIYACEKIFLQCGIDLPIMLSTTVSRSTQLLYGGESIEEFVAAIKFNSNILSVGLNCMYDSDLVADQLKRLASCCSMPMSLLPSAGLSHESECSVDRLSRFVDTINNATSLGLVNIVGGCCGTTPSYISNIIELKSVDFL